MDGTEIVTTSILGWKTAAIFIALFAFGWIYNWFVYAYLPARHIRNRTAELVVGGVITTILGYAILVGWSAYIQGSEAIIGLILCFVASGVPMIIGYWMKDANDERQDDERARERFRKTTEILNNHKEDQ